jgi:thiol:disulfide interchange protein DsbD
MIAALAVFAMLAGSAIESSARISLSAPARLPFVEIENPSQFLKNLEKAEGRPLMVYFSADWCATCSRIERRVFPDPRVVEALAGWRLVKIDVTRLDAGREALMKELRVAGPPTMMFFHGGKQEADGTRLVGSIDARALVASALRAGAG